MFIYIEINRFQTKTETLALFSQISNGKCTTISINGLNNLLQLQDLNDDVVLEIFGKLKFEELVNAADMDYRFRELITKYFMISKYRFKRTISRNDS